MKGKLFQRRTGATCGLLLCVLLMMGACGGSLYKVKPVVDAPVSSANGEAAAGGVRLRAVPLMTDEESQALFEANLPLAGLLPVRVELSNESAAPLVFKRVRFRLRDASGTEWKLRTPKQTVSRILDANEIYLYNPNSRAAFEQALREHEFDIETPLMTNQSRRGLLFFQTPKKLAVESQHGLILSIEGLGQPIALRLN